jgi:hypothetical protein
MKIRNVMKEYELGKEIILALKQDKIGLTQEEPS